MKVDKSNLKSPPAAHAPEAALIVFARDNLWSSLQSIVWCQRTRRLDSLFVYHTATSGVAAEQLRRYCSKAWPALKVVVAGEPGSEEPEQVMARLRDWRAFRPNITDWTLDASGASATMLAAVSRAGAEEPAWLIITATPEGRWQRWCSASGGRLVPAAAESLPQANEADHLELLHLLPALSTVGTVEPLWRESRAAQPLDAAQLAAIVAAGHETNWEWHQMAQRALGSPPHATWDFEDFIAATLLHLGTGSTRVRLPLQLQERPPGTQVIDVVTLCNGKLWLIDCQRRVEPEPPLACDNRLWLGLQAQRLVIRPERCGSESELLLQSHDCQLLDGTACRKLFTRLGAALGLAVPETLRRLERESLAIDVTRRPLFSPATPAQQFSDAMRLATTIYDLPRGAAAEAEGTPPWLAARAADDLWYFSGSLPQPGRPEELRRRLTARLDSSQLELTVVFFEVSRKPLEWRALVRCPATAVGRLVKWLARWRNVPLIT